MSAKALFLKKLQEQQTSCRTFDSKSEADIAAFRLRMTALQDTMESWLTGTGIRAESCDILLSEMLLGGRSFRVPGIHLRFEDKTLRFTPLFLYGQGTTGCVEATLCHQRRVTPVCRLFMRSDAGDLWTYSRAATPNSRFAFSEDAFFDILSCLLTGQ